MNYGRFFQLNTEKSDLSKGIAIFDYIWLKDECAPSDKTPKYPIYAVITKESIEFKAHFYAKINPQDSLSKTHIHNNILSLPLSANLEVKDGLTKALVESYSIAFPSLKNYYLVRLLMQAILNDKNEISYSKGFDISLNSEISDIIKTIEKIEKRVKLCINNNKHDVNVITRQLIDGYKIEFLKKEKDKINDIRYSDFYGRGFVWNNLELFRDLEKFSRKITKRKEIPEMFVPLNWFIRKLILDFLFDLEHTKVFQNSPYYEHVSVKLKENFFFNALANKAMYYYYREIAKDYKTKQEKDKLFFLKEYFLPAEEQWIKSITSPKSDEAFTLKPQGWFKMPEEEMKDLQNLEKDAANTISYFDKIKDAIIKQEEKEDIESRIEKSAKDSSKWQLKKYDLRKALPTTMFIVSGISLLFAVLFAILYHFPFFPNNINTCQTFLIVLLLPLLLGLALFKEIIYCKPQLRYSQGIHLFLPRLLGAIIGAWLMISFASNVLPQFYAIVFIFEDYLVWKNIGVIVILSLLTGVFVYDGINKNAPYLDRCRKRRQTGLLMLIAFFYSYIIGIFATALIGTIAITSKNLDNINYKQYSIHIDFWGSDVYMSPGFLFVFTFVAMFIGLFIERIFEDKQVVSSE